MVNKKLDIKAVITNIAHYHLHTNKYISVNFKKMLQNASVLEVTLHLKYEISKFTLLLNLCSIGSNSMNMQFHVFKRFVLPTLLKVLQ